MKVSVCLVAVVLALCSVEGKHGGFHDIVSEGSFENVPTVTGNFPPFDKMDYLIDMVKKLKERIDTFNCLSTTVNTVSDDGFIAGQSTFLTGQDSISNVVKDGFGFGDDSGVGLPNAGFPTSLHDQTDFGMDLQAVNQHAHTNAQISPFGTSITSTYEHDFLSVHLQYRQRVGAANMYHVRWNPTLATLAQRWSNRCIYAYGQPSFDRSMLPYKKLGLNMYTTTSTSFKAVQAVSSWYAENKYYDYNSGRCLGKSCNSYLQLTYAETREIGCTVSQCSTLRDSLRGNKYNAQFVVCYYGVAGTIDFLGRKPYVLGSPCSSCHLGGALTCFRGLCDSEPCMDTDSRCNARSGKVGYVTTHCTHERYADLVGRVCSVMCNTCSPITLAADSSFAPEDQLTGGVGDTVW